MKQSKIVMLMGATLLIAGNAFAQQNTDMGGMAGMNPGMGGMQGMGGMSGMQGMGGMQGMQGMAPQQAQQSAEAAPPALDAPAQAPAPAQAETPQQSPADGPQGDRQYAMEHKFDKALQYYLEYNPNATAEDFEKMRPYLKPFTDVEVMAEMMSDPRKMAAWMDAITEPDAIYLMMKCSQEPVMWDTWLTGLTDYPALTRAMFRFLDPTTYMNWAAAMFDPSLYGTLAKMIDPNKYVRWAYASGNLKFYEPMIQWVYPSWWDPRVQWLLDPQTFQPVLDLFAIPQAPPQT